MGLPKITVFTPTYNRDYILPQCYEALKRQTCQDFIWLIIDDGSTDETRDLVAKWIDEGKINIQYHKQENMGMHGAHNTGHRLLETELYICCDSDDYLSDDCIEKIIHLWEEKGGEKYAGIIGLNADTHENVRAIIPEELSETTLYDLRYRYKIIGDYKLVYRSDLLKKEPYPIFEGEQYAAVGYKYFKLDKDYKMLVLNQVLCYVEYLASGESSNKMKRYITAPRGFMVYRREMMPLMHNLKLKWWQATHYVSSAIFAKEKRFIKLSGSPWVTILAIPSGVALNMYIRYKNRKIEAKKKRHEEKK
jgi:glycosyltransferase involved in cell wall biosynthesis